MFWSVGCSLLRAEGFFCRLCVLFAPPPSPGNVPYLFWRQYIVVTAVISTANSVKQEGVQCRHYSVLYFLASCLSKNWARDPFEASIASYGSLEFFFKPLWMTTLYTGAKIRNIQGEYKGVTTLPDVWVMSSPQHFFKKRGLDVGRSQKWPCQHLGPFLIEFCSNI